MLHICFQYAGWSALFFAIKEGYLEIAKFLLENKANMSEKDTVCSTACFYFICSLSVFRINKLLLDSLSVKGRISIQN